jgi:hypothetical protein
MEPAPAFLAAEKSCWRRLADAEGRQRPDAKAEIEAAEKALARTSPKPPRRSQGAWTADKARRRAGRPLGIRHAEPSRARRG